jgi:hypothetical protein
VKSDAQRERFRKPCSSPIHVVNAVTKSKREPARILDGSENKVKAVSPSVCHLWALFGLRDQSRYGRLKV